MGGTAIMTDERDLFIDERVGREEFAEAYGDEREYLNLVEALLSRRTALGLSQREVASRMGTTQSAVSELERAEADPRLSTLQRYARSVGAYLGFEVHVAAKAEIKVRTAIRATVAVQWDPGTYRTAVASGGENLGLVCASKPQLALAA
jgi:transcriptional regulator with XRE-family HTH domain